MQGRVALGPPPVLQAGPLRKPTSLGLLLGPIRQWPPDREAAGVRCFPWECGPWDGDRLMVTLNVYNRQGETVGTVDVDPAEFGGKINKQLLHEVVLMHLANQRAGTHSTKRRGEVAGSTKKLFRQKGTGNARVGPRRTNKRRG